MIASRLSRCRTRFARFGLVSNAFRLLLASPLFAFSIGSAAASISSSSLIESEDHVFDSLDYQFRIETLVKDLEHPWSVSFLPDGRILLSDKNGYLSVYDQAGELLGMVKEGFPEILKGAGPGLFDVEPHPDFASNRFLYFIYSKPVPMEDGEVGGFTALARARLKGNDRLMGLENLWFSDTHASIDPRQYGSRIVFKDGYVYFSVGDRADQDMVQRIDMPHGKIMRLHDDGSIPADNPFVGVEGAIQAAWSLGHRNPQGLDFHPGSGQLFSSEHGPRGGDELNIIERGANYGWPVASYGFNYNLTSVAAVEERAGFSSPVVFWNPSLAICGIDFYEGNHFPKWKGDLFVATLAAEELRRLTVVNGRVLHQETLFKWQGRVRDVLSGPDGALYVVFNNPGRLTKLVNVRDNVAHYDQLEKEGVFLEYGNSMIMANRQKYELIRQRELQRGNEISIENDVEALVAIHCQNCHGSGLKGVVGPSLIDGEWQKVKSDQDIARVIEKGIPGTSMPPMGSFLAEEQIKAIVEYIRKQEREYLSAL